MSVKYFSTSALARELSMPAKDLFQKLLAQGFIQRDGENWVLTEEGKKVGGVVKTHPQHGTYIAWEENMKARIQSASDEEGEGRLLSATALGNHFQVSKFRMNPILSELGLVQKGVKGWVVTKLGESVGGKQFEFAQSGIHDSLHSALFSFTIVRIAFEKNAPVNGELG